MRPEDRLRQAFEATPRADFLPPRRRRSAAADRPVDIGHRQTCSQPTTVSQMLALLDVHEGDRVLDLGSGSGWTTALLARLTGPTGSVLGVERIPELVSVGRANVERAGTPWARVTRATPGVLGAPDEGPFDRILVSAGARSLPEDLLRQLRPGGVMVIPVAGRMLRVVREDEPESADPPTVIVDEFGFYRFVPLVSD